MSSLLKLAVAVAPFLLVFLLLRSCAAGEGERWLAEIDALDPGAQLAVNEPDLIVIARSKEQGQTAAQTIRTLRDALHGSYPGILGAPTGKSQVAVLFSGVEALRRHLGREVGPRAVGFVHGYTNGARRAIFLPGNAHRTLRHELVHLLLAQHRAGRPPMSVWLNEGLAQYFESFDAARGNPSREQFSPDLARELDFWRLVDLQAKAFYRGDVSRHYNEAALLVAFLMEQRPRAAFLRYLAAEDRGEHGRKAALSELLRADANNDAAWRAELVRFAADS